MAKYLTWGGGLRPGGLAGIFQLIPADQDQQLNLGFVDFSKQNDNPVSSCTGISVYVSLPLLAVQQLVSTQKTGEVLPLCCYRATEKQLLEGISLLKVSGLFLIPILAFFIRYIGGEAQRKMRKRREK